MLVKPTSRKSSLFASTLALSCGAALVLPGMALAQAINTASTQVAALPSFNAKPSHQARPDIAALRYYATRGEQVRVQAELDRLRKLYPGWKQPENIFSDQSIEEKKLWELYAKGEVNRVHEEISALKKTSPGYEPSVDLIQKLDDRDHRGQIKAAYASQAWQKVVDLTNSKPALLLGNDVELIWWIAEAYARMERPQDALEAYAAAFAAAKTRQERKGTMQRAATLLSTKAALTLVETHKNVDESEVLKGEIEDAIVRGALGRAAQMGEEPPAILNERIAQFEKRAKATGSEADAVVLAWANFGQSRWQQANEWFRVAMKLSNDPKNIEGAIMSAKRMGDITQASTLAAEHHAKSSEISALYINLTAPYLLKEKPQALDADFLQAFADKTLELNSGEGGEALGWYAYNMHQYQASGAWFSEAAKWEETETAIYGQALTARAKQDAALFSELQRIYGSKYERIAKLKYSDPVKRSKPRQVKRRSKVEDRAGRLRRKISRVYKSKAYSRCLSLLRDLRSYGPLNSNDHQMRGWCLLGAKRPSEAERAFSTARRLGGKGKVASAYGQALSALRNGKTNTALEIANSNSLTASQRRVIDIELATQRARAAFDNRDYAAAILALNKRRKFKSEPRDLSFMRAWSHYHAGDHEGAGQIFALLDAQLSSRETRRGLAATRLKTAQLTNPER